VSSEINKESSEVSKTQFERRKQMTNRNKRIFEMLVRIRMFWSTYKESIGKDSQVNQLFERIDAALDKISGLATQQTSGSTHVWLSSQDRKEARENLRKELESLCWTAASMGLKQFFMPRARSDRSLANAGRVFLPILEPLKVDFVLNHLRPDFVDRLRVTVEAIERSIEQQAVSKSARKVATAAINEVQAEALVVVTRVDPIMENLLRDNEPVKAAWYAARHVEKAPAPKKSAEREEVAVAATAA
jgi:hypothetical protein